MLFGGMIEKIFVSEPAITPIFLPGVSFREVKFILKRGFLSDKLAEFIHVPPNEKQRLRGMAIHGMSYLPKTMDHSAEVILYLSELIIHWNERNEDVISNVNKMLLPPLLSEAAILTYSLYKDDVFSVQANAQSVIANDQHMHWKIYRDVLYASSQGQFSLLSQEELSNSVKDFHLISEYEISTKSDIPACRHHVKSLLLQQGYDTKQIMNWLLALSEAITNIIVHAFRGKLKVLTSSDGQEVLFVAEDRGPGFQLETLPKSILLAGYSSKESLGHGFTFMIKLANQVQLYTSPQGSTLILRFTTTNQHTSKRLIMERSSHNEPNFSIG
ncbi:ATP-binding protein [Alkalicoccobacillus murimartini]|uniref:Anti-sigma regulatory factor (Ser/Thr protein kinase) n=1 Tax=Alkalicoccobacillus murimartini TaxID=171685 RepID=A0ABT9YJC0_9BACI|nr:ATP-binding protein [Alkalicoccobacillus murimartini]MDQ0207703.1 anti-sigma regulatory factor (Ser/Thr protein kinase) [Alkalicoccobacillus murimartini]